MFWDMEFAFRKGTLLTKEMLQEVCDYPRDILDILYDGWPDGILAGTALEERSGSVYMKKGLLKYEGRIYRMTEDLDLTQFVSERLIPNDSVENYKLAFLPEEPVSIDGRDTQVRRSMRLRLLYSNGSVDGIEFAHFCLPASKKITISNKEDWKDLSRAKFWDMAECPYSCRGGTTFHPYIFRVLWGKLTQGDRPWNYCALEQLSTTGVLSMDLIRTILYHQGEDLECLDAMQEGERRKDILKKLSHRGSDAPPTVKKHPAEAKANHYHGGKMLYD